MKNEFKILNVPISIFIKNANENDVAILNALGCKTASGVLDLKGKSVVRLCEMSNWTVVSDDWSCGIANSEATSTAIESLGSKYDIFYYVLGDIDMSHSLCLIENGQCKRKKIVDDPNFFSPITVQEIGIPMIGERDLLPHEDVLSMIFEVVKGMGIDPNDINNVRYFNYEF